MENNACLLAKAIALAADRHKDQFDKNGMPYVLHLMAVMTLVDSDDLELKIIAVLHDLVEDGHATFAELREVGFSERVIVALKLLTKMRGQTSDEYMEGIKSNLDAIQVKLADLTHNSDIRRQKGNRPKDGERLVRYAIQFTELKEVLRNWNK